MVRKNLNEFRSRLEPSGSLNTVMRIKLSAHESLLPCHKQKPSAELLQKCKVATGECNQEHYTGSSSKDRTFFYYIELI